ncbi:hypothetical protein D2E25_0875 [Bifidobacterium goeldii]|uniref:Histidine kinase n=1 Tax=Bifidobacterium goeldii TaxID=2306975 RepID=A0A430FLC0_9BIFI|nr:DUF805 domain-containing protein [Bifidobacterium goeldii]RSX53552.1 hypothetical protein D2E25_0875 [Bifidobacterium goeldii]
MGNFDDDGSIRPENDAVQKGEPRAREAYPQATATAATAAMPAMPTSTAPTQPPMHWATIGKPPLWAPWYGIGFGQAIVRFFRKTFVFDGRASRSEYWWGWLFSILLGVSIALAAYGVGAAFGIAGSDSSSVADMVVASSPLGQIASNVLSMVQLLLFIPNLSLSVRRLHDQNRRGWWVILPIIALIVGLIVMIATIIVMAIAGGDSEVSYNQAVVVSVLVFSGFYLLSELVSIMLMIGASDPRGARFDKPDYSIAMPPTGIANTTVAHTREAVRSGNSRVIAWCNRCIARWHELNFLKKTSIIAVVAQVVAIIIVPPDNPLQMLLSICWLAVSAAIPFAPRAMCIGGVIAALLVTFLPAQGWWASGNFALIALFLSLGYVMPRIVSVSLIASFSLLDAVSQLWLGAGSMGAGMVQGMMEMLNDLSQQSAIESGSTALTGHADAVMPQYSVIVFIATVLLDVMILGFLTMFGSAFRRTAEATERAVRTEQLIGRLTREQELAHMIHDSVSNDMSTIAMLAWRAKTVDDDTDMLDAIYERSHHALDRVHEVIDVLNGKRDIESIASDSDELQDIARAGSTADANQVAGANDGSDANDSSTAGTINGIDCVAAIEKYVEDEDRIMHMLGFAGAARVTGTCEHTVSSATHACIMGLLEEIYANIVRHGESTDGYQLFVTISDHVVTITEINPIPAQQHAALRNVRHGRGLKLQRDSIMQLGGTLNTSAQDGAWTLSAQIPLYLSRS